MLGWRMTRMTTMIFVEAILLHVPGQGRFSGKKIERSFFFWKEEIGVRQIFAT